MPELKRLFIGAKMDKDSEARFVSSGDYIDAKNIDLIHPEGGDAGVVRQKKGTTIRNRKSFNLVTGTWDTWTFGWTNPKTVGVIKHTPTDTIYYFVASDNHSAIMELNDKDGVISPIMVDANGVFGWTTSTKITGIQIIEGELGWVVDGEEPCSITISKWKESSTDTTTHTQINGIDFILSDITMIRLAPLTSPTMALSNTLRDGIIEAVTNKNFTVAQNNDGSLSPPGDPGDSINFVLNSGSAFVVGDKVKLTSPAASSDDLTGEYEINVAITSSTVNGSQIVGNIISASTQIQDSVLPWVVELVEGKPLYELLFPRFAYRWRYENNQVSSFSPFTQVAFLPDDFLYNSQNGYNTGMTNNVRKVTLSGFQAPPNQVKEIDILYKASNSTAVYVVETIGATETSFVVTDELLYNLVESNQLLRPWDAVPKSGTALEAVGNRFVIGNYVKGYDVDKESIVFDTALVDSIEVGTINSPEKSLKSLRTYQGGVVFSDALGRETPVISNSTGTIKTTLEDASTSNKLQFKMQGNPPQWATHFKYYIKDTANEYYNLAADRLYQTEDQLATWISFPSSERNKVTVDSYLIAKKTHDQDFPVTDLDNKFKIIDIQSSVPTEVATTKEVIADSNIFFDSNFGDGNEQTTRNAGSTPIPNSKVFLIASDTDDANDGVTSILLEKLVEGNFIRFNAGDANFSRFYKIADVAKSRESSAFVGLGGVSNVHVKVYVTEAFGEDVNFLYTNPSQTNSTLVNNRVGLTVHKEQPLANQEQFTGRFFVKLASNPVLNSIFSASEDYITLNAANCYDGGYINGDVNFKIHAGGRYPRRGYSFSNTAGGLDIARNPSWANDDANDVPYDIVFEKRHRNPLDNAFVAAINTAGTKIRFSNHSTVYTITESRSQFVDYRDDDYTRYWTLLDQRLQVSVSPLVTGQDITVEIVGLEDVEAFTTKNPTIFETEPAEGVDLEFYYEASDAYPIAEYNDLKTLDYFNCFAFGNGVESNRIRDDFNAPVIDKGPIVSTVLDEPIVEERISNEMIFSGIYNSTTGVNNLNQFIIAENITKSVNPIYGSIQKLHARDTDMLVLCEDKILQVLADKDALYNADGSINVTASNAVLGDVRPFVGEFGISKDPASFASYGFRAYFTDRKRGVAIRLSRDGITPIVDGYESELENKFKEDGDIMGSYDDESGTYNLFLNDEVLQYSEVSKGWTSRWELAPDFAITLNNVYYSMKDGVVWAHDDEVNRNTWYGQPAVDSSITVVFNDEPSSIKNFKTISYEGDDGWIAESIETGEQSGAVTTFTEFEGKWFNHIKGIPLSWINGTQSGNLDTKEFSVQGIGNVASISGDVTPTTFTLKVFDDPADH